MKIWLSLVSVSVTGVLAWSFSASPWGRFTCNESRFCSDNEDSMNVASRKNITSIIGMISIRPLRNTLGLRSFMGILLVKANVIDQARPKTLHLVHCLGLQAGEVIEPEQGYQSDHQADHCCNQRLGHASCYCCRIDDSLTSYYLKGTHHSYNSSHQSEQRRGSDNCLQYP